jgi:tRNA(adenine34) deaminase
MEENHLKFMEMAVSEAKKAEQIAEVPVGAVLVSGAGEVLSKAHNQTIRRSDPTAHAEILAIRQAADKIHNYRLLNTTLYVTVEPCVMCMGAIIHARVLGVIYGADDPKWGAAGSVYDFIADRKLNHHPVITKGVLKEACRGLMQEFFQKKRQLSQYYK